MAVPMSKALPADAAVVATAAVATAPAATAPAATAPAATAAAAVAIIKEDCSTPPPAVPLSPHAACCSGATAIAATAAIAVLRPADSSSSSTGSNSGCDGESSAVSQQPIHAGHLRRSLPPPPPYDYPYDCDFDYGYGYDDYPDACMFASWNLHDGGPAPCNAGAYAPPPPLLRPPPFLRHSSPPAVWSCWGYSGGAAAAAAAACPCAPPPVPAGASSAPCSRGHSHDGAHALSGGAPPPHTAMAMASASPYLPTCRYLPYGRPATAMPYPGGTHSTSYPSGSATAAAAAAAVAVAASRWSRPGGYGMPMPMPPPPPPPVQWLPSSAVQYPPPPPPLLSAQPAPPHQYVRNSAPVTTYSDAAPRPTDDASASAAAATVSDGDAAAFPTTAAGPQSQQPMNGGAPKPAGCSSVGAPHVLSSRPGGTLSQAMPAMPYGYGGPRHGHSTGGRCVGSGLVRMYSTRRSCGGCVDGVSGGGGGTAARGMDGEAAVDTPATQNGLSAAAAVDGPVAIVADGHRTPLGSCRPCESSGGPVRQSLVRPSAGVWMPRHLPSQVPRGPTGGDAPPPPPPPPLHHPLLRHGSFVPSWPTTGGLYDGQYDYGFGHGYMYDYELLPRQDPAVQPTMAAPPADFSGGATPNAVSGSSDAAAEGALVNGSATATATAAAATATATATAAAAGEALCWPPRPTPQRPAPVPARFPYYEHVAWPRYHMTPPPFVQALVHRHVPYHSPPVHPWGPWVTREP